MARCINSSRDLARRIFRRAHRALRTLLIKTCARLRSTYPQVVHAPNEVARRFGFIDSQFIEQLKVDFPDYPELVRQQAKQSIAHCFDLLGSGPVIVKHGTESLGLDGYRYVMSSVLQVDCHGTWLNGRINRANLPTARRIWRQVKRGYLPIDWHLDFKSGYRWSESTWHGDIRFGDIPGVDVKVPWELSRMQHLPTLAVACHFAAVGAGGFETTETYALEFRNQVLDFVASNPPGFGVNWACAMDVAIRAANLVVARDIFIAAGTCLGEAFESVFAASLVAHARHVVINLEWSPRYRGNHYIANIVGLLFVAAILPGNDEVDAWFAFAVQELLDEVEYQFHADGSNFEASVCYHRLSAEMVLWAIALLADLPPDKLAVLTRPRRGQVDKLPRLRRGELAMHLIPGTSRESPVPAWCWERLAKMAEFTQAMTRPDGLVVQFGDNDSGRFIKLGSGEQIRTSNDPALPGWSLDHGALIAGIRSLLGDATGLATIDDPTARMLCGLAGLDTSPNQRTFTASTSSGKSASAIRIGDDRVWAECNERFVEATATSRWKSRFPAHSPGLLDGLRWNAYPGMGCYVFRSPRLYLAIRCGEIGLAGLGAHAHCDQLGIELMVDAVNCVRDPGTFIYTPILAKRNAYRSAKAHHVPRVAGCEPANLNLGPFDLRGAAEGDCLFFGPRGFVGRHAGYGSWVYRIIVLESDGVTVCDFSEGGLPLVDPTPDCLPFSHSYGRVIE